ncbi:MAG TPA: cytochrome P450, partial [Silvibacterium sp.]|nr:cytochrome P450 [Silvibacterium sp.]
LLEKWEQAARENTTINATHDLSMMVLDVVLTSIFGDDYEEVAPQFNVLSNEPTRNLEFAQTFRSLGTTVHQIANRRRSQRSTSIDLLGMLMQARDRQTGQTMSDRQLVSEIMTLVVAGHETTASTLNWTWYLLSEHKEAEKKLDEELRNATSRKPLVISDLPKFAYATQVIECGFRAKWGTDSDGKWGGITTQMGRGFDGKWGTFRPSVVMVPHLFRNGAPAVS